MAADKPKRELTGHQARYGFAYLRQQAEDRHGDPDLKYWGIDKAEKQMVEREVERLLTKIIEIRLRNLAGRLAASISNYPRARGQRGPLDR